MLRNLVKTSAASALHWSGVTRWMGNDAPLVLSYHRVVEEFAEHSQNSIPPMLISTRMLERQLDWVGSRYSFVSLDELAAAMGNDAPLVLSYHRVVEEFAEHSQNSIPPMLISTRMLERNGVLAM